MLFASLVIWVCGVSRVSVQQKNTILDLENLPIVLKNRNA